MHVGLEMTFYVRQKYLQLAARKEENQSLIVWGYSAINMLSAKPHGTTTTMQLCKNSLTHTDRYPNTRVFTLLQTTLLNYVSYKDGLYHFGATQNSLAYNKKSFKHTTVLQMTEKDGN